MTTWNAEKYDTEFGYVSALAGGVTELLAARPGERILDLGCGTGEIAAELRDHGCEMVLVDGDPAMVEAATARLGQEAILADGHDFTLDRPVDAVFSNAALHWMRRPAEVVARVRAALRPGGRFVAEMGGAGNCQGAIDALRAALDERGLAEGMRSPWYFPTPEEYRALLAEHGFEVTSMEHFPRLTPMAADAGGVAGWLRMFGGTLTAHVPEDQREAVLARAGELAAPELLRDGVWYVDYHRLRFAAVAKP
ncbi:hypothetical protein SSP35_04_04540 [Streptomyces sp. NBRC 110611]|uniref:class I SAM-dependent methyltransferase n=1 Tax=Streptomyces sp. NBRC 110611 TaxID=1621259 RepID=UPI0008326B53|nr:class I SAM-dependent methyltransferase [Streptomyces sp. NBRC 110611]GAU67366.1 hypothetical protein SSP35_04_04540 [Streptomyces sp. NBRC 110611]